ncbi:hypothetical protein [Streptomyces sp. NPDC058254]|uniref:hypothetical protein n=1 Tax=Streptomyces sp. NPDC058254 TaxID=3346406 RepID=UPI0036EA00FE
MLRVVYEAADDLKPDKPVEISEDRGIITVRIRRTADAPTYTAALNGELEKFLANSEWFQLWKDEIVSPQSSECPVRVVYVLDLDGALDAGDAVEIREHRGLVEILVDPEVDVARFVAALNRAIEEFLAGGQWFQHWQGEIVT